MKRVLFVAALCAISTGATSPAASPVVHASASCVAASKPGRIRCRALLELPLDAVSTQKLTWGQLTIVASDPSIPPLRARPGPKDTEVHEDGRWAWSFSVAAAESGEHSMKVRLSSTVEAKSGGGPSLVTQDLDVTIRVAP